MDRNGCLIDNVLDKAVMRDWGMGRNGFRVEFGCPIIVNVFEATRVRNVDDIVRNLIAEIPNCFTQRL